MLWIPTWMKITCVPKQNYLVTVKPRHEANGTSEADLIIPLSKWGLFLEKGNVFNEIFP